jgi:hypothetical protein
MTRILLILLLCLAPALAWAHGDTFPSTDTTIIAVIDSNGNVVNVGDLANRALRTTIVSGSSGASVGGCTSTAAAPTYVEGTDNAISCDNAGNVRQTFGTLLSGEDQTNNLLMTSGGTTRGTVGNVATGLLVAGDATPTTPVALPVGSKTIYGSVDGTGAVTQTQKVYGGLTNGVTATTGELLCTLTLSGTTHAHAVCPPITANFLFYMVVTSSTTGTSATGVVTAMY